MIGCVLYEMFSEVHQPWPGMDTKDVTAAVCVGKQMEKPQDCPDVIYDIMHQCWTFDPKVRLNSAQVYDKVRELRDDRSLLA